VSRRCQLGVGDPGDVEPCGDVAPFEVETWGQNEANDGMALCLEHAIDAHDDGALVTGPYGHPCRWVDDDEFGEGGQAHR
jgi:hypothetical protein